MLKFKRYLAVCLAALLLLFSCSACAIGKNTTIAMTIGDTDIPVGLYTLYMIDAQQEAISKISEASTTVASTTEADTTAAETTASSTDATTVAETTVQESTATPDYYSMTVEDKDFSTWVQDRAEELCKKYVAVNNLFTTLKLTLSDDDQQTVDDSVTQYWDQQKDKLTKVGVSEQSFRLYTECSVKQNAIFNAYYGEGGSREVPQNDIFTALVENYATVKALSTGKSDSSTGSSYSDDVISQLRALCDTCAQRINNGENFDTVQTYFNDQVTYITTGEEPTTAETTEAVEETTSEEDVTSEATTEATTEYDQSVIMVAKSSIESGGDTAKLISAVFDDEVNKASVVELDSEFYVLVRVGDLTNNSYYITNYSNNVLQLLKGDEMSSEFDSLATALQAARNDKAIQKFTPKKLTDFIS